MKPALALFLALSSSACSPALPTAPSGPAPEYETPRNYQPTKRIDSTPTPSDALPRAVEPAALEPAAPAAPASEPTVEPAVEPAVEEPAAPAASAAKPGPSPPLSEGEPTIAKP